MHKQVCSLFKANMDHIVSMSLHDFPFTYYPQSKPLGNYNTVNTLVKHGVHNIGVYRRLCLCYQDVPMGDLFSETMTMIKDSKITNPKDIFNTSGLESGWFPLSAPLKNSRNIKNWKDLFETKGISFDDIAPFVLDNPMTVWHFLNLHILDSVDANIKGMKKLFYFKMDVK